MHRNTARDPSSNEESRLKGYGDVGVYSGTVTLRDSTLTGNAASVFGGGIANFGTLTIRDSKVRHNSAPLGGDLSNAGLVSLFNSIIGDRHDV